MYLDVLITGAKQLVLHSHTINTREGSEQPHTYTHHELSHALAFTTGAKQFLMAACTYIQTHTPTDTS